MIRVSSRLRCLSHGKNRLIRPSCSQELFIFDKNDRSINEKESICRQSFLFIDPVYQSNYSYNERRFFSTEKDFSTTETVDSNTTNSSVDDTLNKLFEESQQQLAEKAVTSGDAWYTATETVTAWTPTWYNLSDQAIVAVRYIHEITGLEYGWSIVATTIALRLVLFPVMVSAQQTTSRMAHVQPELQLLKKKFELIGTPTRQEQVQFSNQLKALFKRYNVKPFRAFLGPAIQLPVFIGMFFGLRKMPSLFPNELSTGGMFWFTDLTVPDPLYILPVASAATFFGLIELGKEQMTMNQPGPQGQFMLNFFRVMAVMSLPICINFESAMLCYWTTNNFITIGQTSLLKTKAARNYFGIWDPPKPIPGQEAPDISTSISNLVKRAQGEPVTEAQKIKQHNEAVEAKKASFRMTRATRAKRKGITGTQNR